MIFLKINLKFLRKEFWILFLLQSQALGLSPHMPQSKRQEELWEIFRASLLQLKIEKEKISQRKKTEIFSLLCTVVKVSESSLLNFCFLRGLNINIQNAKV